jgi:peptide/nickel transport system substrate-binding protein
MFDSYQVGSVERQVRNPNYWQKGFPYPDARSLTIIPDSAAGEAAFRSNQTDRTGFQDIKQAESVARDLGDKIIPWSYQTASGMALLLNIRKPLFQDIRMREAIHRAMDVQRVINVVYFGDAVRQHVFPNARPSRFPLGFDAVKDLRGLDKQRAKQLVDALKADGVYKGEELTFMLPVEAQTWVDSGTLLAEDFEEVGIKIKMESIVRNIYLQKAGPKPEDGSPSDFDITMTVYLDYNYFTTAPASFWQNAGLEDAEIDAIVDQIEGTVDSEARAELSHRFERMMAEKYSNFVPIQAGNNHRARYAYVKGIDFELSRSGVVGHTSPSSGQLGLWLDEGRADA